MTVFMMYWANLRLCLPEKPLHLNLRLQVEPLPNLHIESRSGAIVANCQRINLLAATWQ